MQPVATRTSLVLAASVATLALLAPRASAGTSDELLKLLPADGAADDAYGVAVALGDGVALVGAIRDDDNGADTGSAYLMDLATGQQLLKLLPTDQVPGQWFGRYVAIQADRAVIAAPLDDEKGFVAGAAYLFDVTTGQQIAKLHPADAQASHYFGIDVAMDAGRALIGCYGDDTNGKGSGAVYVFDVSTGAELAKLLPNDGAAGDHFGNAVAISSSTAVIGAFEDDVAAVNSGSAYVFDVGTGQQVAKLVPSDGSMNAEFGQSVAIDGDLALVGAWRDGQQAPSAGAAYLFDATTGQQLHKFVLEAGETEDYFGWSVALHGGIAAVSAPNDRALGAKVGSIVLFDVASRQRIGELVASDGQDLDWLGGDLALVGSKVLAGAPGTTTTASTRARPTFSRRPNPSGAPTAARPSPTPRAPRR